MKAAFASCADRKRSRRKKNPSWKYEAKLLGAPSRRDFHEAEMYKYEFMDHSKYISILFANTNLIGDYIRKTFNSYNYMKFDEMEAKKNIILLSFLL